MYVLCQVASHECVVPGGKWCVVCQSLNIGGYLDSC